MDIDQFLMKHIVDVKKKESEVELFNICFNASKPCHIIKYISEIKEQGKDSKLSTLMRKHGNVFCEKGDYSEAMYLYYKSIELAPYDSLEYAIALANRSAILFAMKRYEDCLVDINRVLVSKYPKLLMYKIFNRQAKCLLELKRYEAAVGVVDVWKLWLENEKINLTQEQIDNTLKSINDIEKLIPEERVTADGDEQTFAAPSFIHGENPHFAYASKTVAFKKNKRLGRHVIANSNIKKGDILFIEDPYSTSCVSAHSGYYTYCNQCFAGLLTCIPCKFCTEIYFCSEQCRELFWNLRHRWECVAIRKSLLCSEYSLALGILFRSSRTGFNSTVLQKDAYGNKEDNYPYVNQLATHITDMPMDKMSIYIRATVLLVTYLIHFTDYFDWLSVQDNRPKGSSEELYRIVGGILLKTLLQIDSNSETVQYNFICVDNKFTCGFAYHTVAHALYVSSSSMNHSCVSNAVGSFHGSTKIVKALTDIQKGKEITVCYITGPNLRNPELRQQELNDNYYFKCTCRLCTNTHELSSWLCNQCQGEALTTFDRTSVRCQDCQHVYPIKTYIDKELDISVHLYRTLFSIPQMNADSFILGLTELERIYFRDNVKFLPWYWRMVDYCKEIGDFQGCLKYLESMYRIQQLELGETAFIENVHTFLWLCVSRVNYCLSLNMQTSANYEKASKEATDSIHQCADLLLYHMSPKVVDCFKKNMLQILAAGNLNYDQTMLSLHFNNIPWSAETRTRAPRPRNKLNFSFRR